MRRRFDPNRKSGEIFVGQQPTFLCVEIGDLVGDFALIDQIAGSPDSRRPIAARSPFSIDHPLEGIPQIFLEKDLPNLWDMSARIEDRIGRWVAAQLPTRKCVELIVDRMAGKSALQSLIREYRDADPRVSLVLFPEGTRINEKGLGKFKAGSVVIAQTLGKNIQPVCIFGTMDLMPRHRMIPKAGTIRIRVLDDFAISREIPVGEQLPKLQSYMSDRYSELEMRLNAEP